MPRRGAEVQRSEGGPFGYAIFAISGSIRNPDDAHGLSVEVTVQGGEVTMRADGADLGQWPLDAVRLHPIDTTSYEFIAEGDRLIFVPDDRPALAESPLLDRPPPKTIKEKRREQKQADKDSARAEKEAAQREKERAKATKVAAKETKERAKAEKAEKAAAKEAKGRAKAEKAATKQEKRAGGDRAKAEKAAAKQAKKASAKLKTDAKSKRKTQETETDATESTAGPHDAVEAEEPRAIATTDLEPETTAEQADSSVVDMRLPEAPRKHKKRRKQKRPDSGSAREKPEKPKKLEKPKKPKKPKKERASVWITTLDTARKHDMFDLDRVQVDESKRGEEHEHTWDHRTARSFGIGARVCTICGKIRLKVE